jgi:hypothetical protein
MATWYDTYTPRHWGVVALARGPMWKEICAVQSRWCDEFNQAEANCGVPAL